HPFLLHEVLHANGYRNYQVLSGDQTYFMKSRDILYGASDHFYDGNMARGYFLNDDQLVLDHVAALQDWDGRPTFIQVHLMSAHILR
ncbi:hypothetical protein, partial [Streptomyces brasiliscabiei]|uniref:hypothetical protein n=1 Tax=Streptomyces brasiliscabiei TaxID=2736302 RepID=UPI003014CDAD